MARSHGCTALRSGPGRRAVLGGDVMHIARLVFLLALGATTEGGPPATPAEPVGPGVPSIASTDVFAERTGGYFAYRIPALETAPDGSILAFAEARKYNLDDPGFGQQD